MLSIEFTNENLTSDEEVELVDAAFECFSHDYKVLNLEVLLDAIEKKDRSYTKKPKHLKKLIEDLRNWKYTNQEAAQILDEACGTRRMKAN